jgi:hypothetical protein
MNPVTCPGILGPLMTLERPIVRRSGSFYKSRLNAIASRVD